MNVTNTEAITSVKIFDASGKMIRTNSYEKGKNLSIDMRNFKTGTYIVQLNDKETYKIIKE